MEFENTRLYKAITEERFDHVTQEVRLLVEQGRDVTFRSARGETFLHVVAGLADKFRHAQSIPVVYQLCLAGCDVNAQNEAGDTCLHVAMRQDRPIRVVIALMRCGADSTVRNPDDQTPHDVLQTVRPPGWQETLHAYLKFHPGLLQSVTSSAAPDVELVERLLASWSRVRVWQQGRQVSLADVARKRGCSSAVVTLLRRREHETEVAAAVLAGSVKRLNKLLTERSADLNIADASYQYRYPETPVIPQPLLAAAWEQNNFNLVDAIMTHRPDTSRLHSNLSETDKRPLFFQVCELQVMCGHPRPSDPLVTLRIIKSSDLCRRNVKGQTILFEAIKHNKPRDFLWTLLSYGVDLASRDYKGRTARDFAQSMGDGDYVDVLDDYVLETMEGRDVEVLEGWVLQDYDHIQSVLERSDLRRAVRVREKIRDGRLLKEVDDFLKSLEKMKILMQSLLQAGQVGDTSALSRLSCESTVWRCRNRSGQTVLHRALLHNQNEAVTFTIVHHPEIINIPDNMLRTPLHYAYLMCGPQHHVTAALLQHGACAQDKDVLGRVPEENSTCNLSVTSHKQLLDDVTQFSVRLHLSHIRFNSRMRDLIQGESGLGEVQALLAEADCGEGVNLEDRSYFLLDCLAHARPDIALTLLQHGAHPEKCPQEVSAGDGEAKLSVLERARQLGYSKLVHAITELTTPPTGASPVEE